MGMDAGELYRTYFTDVYRYLLSLSQDKNLAEELTQETFFKALQKIDGFHGQCHIRVWLCQIGKNAYLDYLRRHKRLVPMEEKLQQTDSRDPILDLEKKETASRLHRILHALPEPYKEVFSLRVFGELPFKEIGSLFEKSESWAKMTYLRARRKIQEAMQDENHM